MPYITQKDRKQLLEGRIPGSAGEMDYMISALINIYVNSAGDVNYSKLNEVIGLLECAKLELYRRKAAPYEDSALNKNGDVYDF